MQNRVTRVLQVSPEGLSKAGVQADIMFPIRILPPEDVHFDVVLFTDEVRYYDEEFSKTGTIYRIPLKKRKNAVFQLVQNYVDFFVILKNMRKLLKTVPQYDAIHCRNDFRAAACLVAAKEVGIPVRIAHSHMNKPERINSYVRIYNAFHRFFIRRNANVFLGVTQNAADYVFGTKVDSHVIKNPTMDLDKFTPSKYPEIPHDGIRLIQVGSYRDRKNQLFSLDILQQLKAKNGKAELIFIGFDPTPEQKYLTQLKKHARDLQVDELVTFLPSDTNVAEQLRNSDYMLLPSKLEGLPNVALESQAMGVPCFLTDTIVQEADHGLCCFLPLEKGPEYWAEAILKYRFDHGAEKRYVDMSDYDNKAVCMEHLAVWRGEKYGRD